VVWLARATACLSSMTSAAKTLPELVKLAKNARQARVGVPGAGTNYRIAVEQLRDITGVDLTLVPYKGSAPPSPTSSAARSRSRSTASFRSAPDPGWQDPRARGARRHPHAGPARRADHRRGRPARRGDLRLQRDPGGVRDPRPIIDKINAAVNEVLADPDTIARGRTLGLRIGGGPPEQLRQIMDKVTEIYARLSNRPTSSRSEAGALVIAPAPANDPGSPRKPDGIDFVGNSKIRPVLS